MQCESYGNPDAVNVYSGAAGLFQFMRVDLNTLEVVTPSTWTVFNPLAQESFGIESSSPFDPTANIATAWYLVDYSIRTGLSGGPWHHWATVCRP